MYRELLEEVSEAQSKYGEQKQPPCTEASLRRLKERTRQELGEDLPEEYAAFLREQNGLNWNGLFIYAGETSAIVGNSNAQIQGLVEANLDWRSDEWFKEYLVFGEGNMDLYVCHLPSNEYRVIDRVPGNVHESHPSFNSLLASALRAHL